MSQITFTELDGVGAVTTDHSKFISTSDSPALKFNYKFEIGKRYRIVGKLFHADYCFPQPTLRFFDTNTKKMRFVAFFYNSNKNKFDLVFRVENPDEVITILPFFQKGSFEFQNITIQEISDLSFRFFKIKIKIRPYFSFFEYRFRLILLVFYYLKKTGLKSTIYRILEKFKRSYRIWILFFDRNDFLDRMRTRKMLGHLKQTPMISIVMPVYNVDKRYLVKALDSVRNQIYQNWELCIADDCSTLDYIRPYLEKVAAQEPRIKIVFREKNGHISEATNSALTIATGEFIALMDHDDLMVDSALVYVAAAIEKNPGCALIYTDEDKISETGRRFSPFFKPDWSPDLFFSMNILTHLNVFKADQVRKMGGFRKGYEGSQDYDFCLRYLEMIKDDQVVHIPRILYHWRAIEGSVALDSREKQYAHDAARRAIREHHERKGQKVSVGSGYGPLHRVIYEYNKADNKVSIVICTRDAKSILKICIDSIIQKTSYPNYEIIVVDNGSKDKETFEYFESLKTLGIVKTVRIDLPFNYSLLNNEGVKLATGNIVCFLNNDIEVISPNWLEELVMHAQRPEIGAVGAKLHYPSGGIQHFGIVTGLMGGVAGHPFKHFASGTDGYFGRMRVVGNVSAVTGACLVMRKDVFEKVGGFDAEFLPIAYNDVDLCLKVLKLNLRIVVTPFAELVHHESLTRGIEDTPEKIERLIKEQELMKKRWGSFLKDRYYNQNLTLNSENYGLAWPPVQS